VVLDDTFGHVPDRIQAAEAGRLRRRAGSEQRLEQGAEIRMRRSLPTLHLRQALLGE
jgi:hypothetical protein